MINILSSCIKGEMTHYKLYKKPNTYVHEPDWYC